MLRHKECRPRNQDHVDDDGADLAVSIIAARFGLTHSTARVVCELAHIGAGEDRAPASGGRAA
jgi:hypothetical protein